MKKDKKTKAVKATTAATKKEKKLVTMESSGILGFCYRSPAVVKFMLPVTHYVVVFVSETGVVTNPLNTIAESGARTVVFMHKSLAGMRTFIKRCLESSTGARTRDLKAAHHIVFDVLDQLTRYPEIKLMDLKAKSQADWQVQKTYPEQIIRYFDEHGVGINADAITRLTDPVVGIDAEDMIHTDKKVKDVDRQDKVKSMLHVIQDLQAKNADKRNQIQRLICGFVSGQFIDGGHKTTTKTLRVCRDPDLNRTQAEATLILTKKDKTGLDRSLELLAEQFRGIGLPLRRPALEKIKCIVSGGEYVALMRALLLIQQYRYAPDQACARTGANVCAVALVRREVFDESTDTLPSSRDAVRHRLGAVTLVKRTQAQTVPDIMFADPVLRVWNRYRKAVEVPEPVPTPEPKQEQAPAMKAKKVGVAKPVKDTLTNINKHDASFRDSVLDDDVVAGASDSTPSESIGDALTEDSAFDNTKVKKEPANPSARKTIPAGTYSLTDIVRACNLCDPGLTDMAVLSMSRTPVSFSGARFVKKIKNKKTNKTVSVVAYELGAGKRYRLRWRGTLYRILAAAA